MYAEGDGVPHDDLKAFEFFSRIADDTTDEGPDAQNSGVVASAFTALGTYFLDGIKGTYVRPNPERAYDMFNYAASYFGDPNAQYNLGRLYLDGTGVDTDARQAARWFNLAAEKGHAPAQALLGQLLVNGQGVPAQRARGLMWLSHGPGSRRRGARTTGSSPSTRRPGPRPARRTAPPRWRRPPRPPPRSPDRRAAGAEVRRSAPPGGRSVRAIRSAR